MVTLTVNGEKRDFAHNVTLFEVMEGLQITQKVMAAAVNMVIVKKEEWMTYEPQEGDVLELLHFVGGG